jgi:hypothetical protein
VTLCAHPQIYSAPNMFARRDLLLPALAALYRTPRSVLTLPESVSMIRAGCDPAFLAAIRHSGRMLYRGEDLGEPCILRVAPDLLVKGTYPSDAALTYFSSLEKCLSARGALAKPSTGHIGVADRALAATWGEPASVWPLGRLSYCWPVDQRDFWPISNAHSLEELTTHLCDREAYRVDTGLTTALASGHEVLFSTCRGSSFVAIPAGACGNDELLSAIL